MLKLTLIGYGQMGKMLEQLAPEMDMEIVSIIDPVQGNEICEETVSEADVCIDFTLPDSVLSNIKKLAELNKTMVVGTTGWHHKLDDVTEMVNQTGVGFIHGSNFSPGMNMFFQVVKQAAMMFNNLDDYDVYGLEYHHKRKIDSPSGTAKVLSDIILNNVDRKTEAQFDKLDRKVKPEEFHLASVRAGEIPGTHIIGFDTEADSIELKHTARNRNGLAKGALLAAKWIADKKGVYDFSESFEQIIQKSVR